jgi:hypothetical protein
LQEREAHSEQQRVKSIQQGKKCEEDSDLYVDNKKDNVRLHKVTEEVSGVCLRCSSLKILNYRFENCIIDY